MERALEGLELGLGRAGQGDSVLERMRERSHPPHGCRLGGQGCKRGAGAAQAGGMHPQSTHPHLQGPIALSPRGEPCCPLGWQPPPWWLEDWGVTKSLPGPPAAPLAAWPLHVLAAGPEMSCLPWWVLRGAEGRLHSSSD